MPNNSPTRSCQRKLWKRKRRPSAACNSLATERGDNQSNLQERGPRGGLALFSRAASRGRRNSAASYVHLRGNGGADHGAAGVRIVGELRAAAAQIRSPLFCHSS